MTGLAVAARALTKSYGSHTALAGVDLAVPRGTVLGLLGPNGAGKTTLVRILATLLPATSGTAVVAGYDVGREAGVVRKLISLAGQFAAVDEMLTGAQNLELVARLRHLGRREARRRVAELLEEFELLDAADEPIRTYSGGMRRRLDLAACLVTVPTVLFLDEPTTGLDPLSRKALWRVIGRLVERRVTLVLTTQYLEEADELADAIVVIDKGRVIAEGSPADLKAQVGADRIVIDLAELGQWAAALDMARSEANHPVSTDERRLRMTLLCDAPLSSISRLGGLFDQHGIGVRHLALRPPSLDEVFVELMQRPQGSCWPTPPLAAVERV